MLEIRTENGVSLDLLPDTQIDIELTNPMFNEVGSHSLGFDLPVTPKNSLAFNFVEKIETIKSYDEGIFIEIIFNELTYRGKLFYKSVTNERYRCYVTLKEGYLIKELENLNLRNVNYGGTWAVINNAESLFDYLKAISQLSYPQSPITSFPIRNDEALDGSMDDITKDLINAHTLNNYETDYSLFTAGPVINNFGALNAAHFFAIYPYVDFVINKTIKHLKFHQVTNPFEKHPELNSLVLFNLESFKSKYPLNIEIQNFVPDEMASELLLGLRNLFGLQIFINDDDRNIEFHYLKDIINNNDVIKLNGHISKTHEIDSENLKTYLFDFEFENDNYTAVWLKEIPAEIQGTVDYKESLPFGSTHNGDIYYVSTEDAYYIFKPVEEGIGFNWYFFGKKLQSLSNGGNNVEILSSICPLVDYVHTKTDRYVVPGFPGVTFEKDRRYLVPRMDARMNYFNTGSKCGIRMVFYRGYQPCNEYYYDTYTVPPGERNFMGSMMNYYPMGSQDVYNQLGTKIADYALRWDTENGLYEKFWKEYIYWYLFVRKPVKKLISLTPFELTKIRMYKKHEIGGMRYFIDKLKFSIRIDRISTVEMDLLVAS